VPDAICGPTTCTAPNRGVCAAVNGRAVCSCDPGFRDNGQGLCVVADPCANNPCVEPNRSVCAAGANNTAICSCDPGYSPQGNTCAPVDPCASNPCTMPNRNVCTAQGSQAVCGCNPGYGEQGGACAPLDPCASNPCTMPNRGVCTVESSQAVCGCNPGYQLDMQGMCALIPPPTCANQHTQGDMYEPNECPSLATFIMPGQTQSHQLLPIGDRDFFRFDAQAGEIIEFAETSNTDVVVTMFGADGMTILASSDSPEWLRQEFAQAGTYYASVRHYGTSATGTHSVRLTSLGLDDHGDNIQTATPITNGQSINGVFETYGDRDLFSFQAQAGRIYRIEETTNTDVVMGLFDSAGTLITSTDSPEWFQWEAPTSGTYYFSVRHYGTSAIGSHTVKLTDIGVDDHGDNIQTATPITNGQSINGVFETYGDRDLFSFQAQAGRIYRIEETTNTDVVMGLFDSAGTLITSTDTPEWFQWEAPTTGTYYFSVRHYGSAVIGSHTVKITDIGVDDHGDDIQTGTMIVSGQSINGVFETYGDRDFFSFQAQADHIYRIEETTNTDVVMGFFDAQGNLLTSTDSPESITRELAQGGAYHFSVRHYGSASLGSHTVKITDLGEDDHGDNAMAATALGAGAQTSAGMVETTGDVDVFSFTAAAGEIVRITSSTSPAVSMTLLAADGTTALRSSTSGLIAHKLAQAGTYYVSLRLSSSTQTGSYTLNVLRDGADDHSDGAPGATAIMTGGQANAGALQFFGDQDWFTFTAAAGQVYSIRVAGLSQARVTLYDAAGTTSLGSQTNGALFPMLTQGTTYTVRVDATSATTLGAYTLTVSD
jgi:Pyruvate/2-oxoacid:ferredoxin oxidoreductase gamma subunit